MKDSERAIRSVTVAGGGIVGLSAALAFRRALPAASVTVVDLPRDAAALADRLPFTLPPVGRFHAAIGVDEIAMVGAGIATHHLGTRFAGWSADGAPWVHAFGSTGAPAGAAPFRQAWLAARRGGYTEPFHRHSAAAAIAAADKFVHPSEDPGSPLSTYLYALRLDPERYRAHLAGACARGGAETLEGALGAVERREDGGIAALALADGRRLEADLFLDCSGPGAALLSLVEDRFEDWIDWLPCDRLLIADRAGPGRLGSRDDVEAGPEGWRWSAPLQDRLSGGFAFSSAVTAETKARALYGVNGAELVAIRPGRRPEPWVRNVLALGDASVALDPLHGANLHLAQSAILRALELLPGRDCHKLELAEYNRRTERETARVRDFVALHYLRSGCTGPLWEPLAGRAPPETLGRTLEQFERRGRLPFFEEESFDAESWSAVLLGLGVVPRHVDPAAVGVDVAAAAAAMKALTARLDAQAASLPVYADYLKQLLGRVRQRPR